MIELPCATCGDKGITVVNWADAPSQYAVCLCRTGEEMRRKSNGSTALWRLWAAREQVDPEDVLMLEDALTPAELTERGFQELTGETAFDAIAAAAQKRNTEL